MRTDCLENNTAISLFSFAVGSVPGRTHVPWNVYTINATTCSRDTLLLVELGDMLDLVWSFRHLQILLSKITLFRVTKPSNKLMEERLVLLRADLRQLSLRENQME